jgi:hypothetical protein
MLYQLTISVFICKKHFSKPVKQEVNGPVILPPLVFPGQCLAAALGVTKLITISVTNLATLLCFLSLT